MAGKPKKPFDVSDYDIIQVDDNVVRVDGYGKEGFLVNGVEYYGSMLMYGSTSLVWSPRRPEDITVDRCVLHGAVRTGVASAACEPP
jgi:uncharacterized protein